MLLICENAKDVTMDNQQVIGLVARLNWLAGITDGEGCIALMVFPQKKRGGFRLQARVTIANTDLGIIDRISSILAELDVKCHIQKQDCISKYTGTKIKTGKIVSLVHISSTENIQKLLKVLLPYLASSDKIKRGEILLKLIEQRAERCIRENKRNNISYTQEDVNLILEFLSHTRSKQIERLTKFLNEHTREARFDRSREGLRSNKYSIKKAS